MPPVKRIITAAVLAAATAGLAAAPAEAAHDRCWSENGVVTGDAPPWEQGHPPLWSTAASCRWLGPPVPE